jgi:hypothetical protein
MTTTIKTPSADQINLDCDESYYACVVGVRRNIGHGALRNRGRWVRVIAGGESIVDNGEMEWTGTQERLNRIIDRYANWPGLDGIYIEGGVDWAATRGDFGAGDYEPWAGEWAVNIYLPE